jgi:hypothetical protein
MPAVIKSEALQVVARVGHQIECALHPFRVMFDGLHVRQRFGLAGKRRVRRAIGLAYVPSLARLAGVEKTSWRYR